MEEIYVTKPHLPDRKKFDRYVDRIYKTSQLTNNGPLVQKLEKKLCEYLGVKNIVLTANGTLALQIAYKILGLEGEVITTPFSFVATTSSLIWEKLRPVFADIDPETLDIDASLIESKITKKTSAILPVHVFGNPCDVEKIQKIASKNDLKVIYDAAHAFDVKYKSRSILKHGDISILSFHATKLFHTIEGGALIINNDKLYEKAKRIISFGYGDDSLIHENGINAKMNEFSAIMGLCLLEDMKKISRSRRKIWEYYHKELKDMVGFQKINKNSKNNFSYFPVIFKNSRQRERVHKALKENKIFPRRYFWPSLDSLDYLKKDEYLCKNSRDISERILSLPIYPDLETRDQKRIVKIIKENI